MSLLGSFGMLLQLLGLGALPLAIVLNLAAGGDSFEFGPSNMLILMVSGLALFYLGHFIRGYAENTPDDDEEDSPRPKQKSKKK